MASFCESCGSSLEDGALFCTVCGAKVDVDEEVVEVASEPEAIEVVDIPPLQASVVTIEPMVVEEVPAPAADEIASQPSPLPPPEPQQEVPPVPELEPVNLQPAPESEPQPQPVNPAEASPVSPSEVYSAPEPQISHTAPDKPRSKTPIFALIGLVVLVFAAGGIWLLVRGKKPNSKEADKPTMSAQSNTPPNVTGKPNSDKPLAVAAQSQDEVSKLRTEVTKVLSNVSAAGWSDAICKTELPILAKLTQKVKDLGRDDLSSYWSSLSLFIKACNAANRKDRSNAKQYLTEATKELSLATGVRLDSDATLKGDIIGSIGSYQSLANDIGLPSDYIACQKLDNLKKELNKQ